MTYYSIEDIFAMIVGLKDKTEQSDICMFIVFIKENINNLEVHPSIKDVLMNNLEAAALEAANNITLQIMSVVNC